MSDELISKGFMKKVAELDIMQLEQLLLYLPSKYLDFRKPAPSILSCLNTGEKVYLKLKLIANPEINENVRPAQIRLRFTDGVTVASSMVFGSGYVWREFKEGHYIHLTCKVEEYNGYPQIKNPEVIPLREQNRIVPYYKGKEKVVTSQKLAENIAVALREFLSLTTKFIVDTLGVTEEKIISCATPGFSSIGEVLKAVHRPKTMKEAQEACGAVRLINAYHALLLTMNLKKKESVLGSRIDYSVDLIKSLIQRMPFAPTNDQKRAIWDITKDLNSDSPMDRLLSGDVGTGKTVAYVIPAVCAQKSGKNVVILMPNLLLASQVAKEIKSYFPEVPIELVIGGQKRSDKITGNPIIVGTSAILWWFKSLEEKHQVDFLIIDEQQKLGNSQKTKLLSAHTNILEATATAIPRTTALVKYGNKSISCIEECPVKKNIITKISGSDEKKEAYDSLIEIVKSGFQIAVLYPIRKKEFSYCDLAFSSGLPDFNVIESELIDAGADNVSIVVVDDDLILGEKKVIRFRVNQPSYKRVKSLIYEKYNDDVQIIEIEDPVEAEICKKNVENAAQRWEIKFPGRVVMIHGGLNIKDKLEAIRRAKSGECDIIITSSVIEIGLTMPDLRGMLVVDGDKYGASTLHQIRGRLARQGGNGLFMMSVDTPVAEMQDKSRNRLNLLVRHTKGVLIAEEDMLQRGFGDLSMDGVKQAGFMSGIFPGLKLVPQDIETLVKSTGYVDSKSPTCAA